MKVNGIDIRKYNAAQLTVDLQPPKIALDTEWVEGAAAPQEFKTDIKFGTLKLEIYFRGSNRNAITRTMSQFLGLFTTCAKLKLDGYKGTYIGYLSSDSITKKKVADRYIMTLQFNGYMTDDEVSNTYKDVTEAKFKTLGTRNTPCVVEIVPQVNLQEFRITGFGDADIILTNMKRDVPIIIDGQQGTVTENGANKFAECDMWEFPILKKDAENIITFSSTHCHVTIHYSPMWL